MDMTDNESLNQHDRQDREYEKEHPWTGICRACGAAVVLVASGTGESYKWVTNVKHPTSSWHCGNDPNFPVKAHVATRESMERLEVK